MAPVEIIFGALKSKLRACLETGKVKLEKPEGMRYVQSQLKELKFEIWINAWKEVIKESKEAIIWASRLNNMLSQGKVKHFEKAGVIYKQYFIFIS